MTDLFYNALEAIWDMLNEMSPYLLFGFLIAGLMHAFVPGNLFSKYLAGNSFRSVVNAALFGIPLPLCSCGVIPTAMSLRKEGASKGAAVSFLIATPQTGIDSILATYSLMGLPFAILRPIAAFVTALFGGQMVNRFGNDKTCETSNENDNENEKCCCHHEEAKAEEERCCCHHEEAKAEEEHCCCHHEEAKAEEEHCCCHHEEAKAEEEHCCCHHEEAKAEEGHCCCHHEESKAEEEHCCCHHHHAEHAEGFGGKLKDALVYAFGEMMEDIGKWLVIGIIAAGVISLIPSDWFAIFKDNTLASILLVLVLSIPMYLCATGSIPIAVALMLKGLTPGAALVMLMAGPASNMASIMVLGKKLGRRTLITYLASIVLGAIAFALIIDFLLPKEWFMPTMMVDELSHQHETSWFAIGCSILLIALLAKALLFHGHHEHECHCHEH